MKNHIYFFIEWLTNEKVDYDVGKKCREACSTYLRILIERAYSPLKNSDFLFRFYPDHKIWLSSVNDSLELQREILDKYLKAGEDSNATTFMETVMNSGLSYHDMSARMLQFIFTVRKKYALVT